MAPLQPSSQRILSVDATRGFAMAFVCLSHFCWTLEFTRPRLAELLENVAMIATPTFLLLSGAMLGLLQLRRAANLPGLATRLFHRGLFVLIVGHLVISGASALAHDMPYLSVVLNRVYITDVVGICLMLLPRITAERGVRPLLATGIAMYLAAVLISYMWQPVNGTAIVIEQMFLGRHGHKGHQLMEYASPIIPYIGVYVAGIGLGTYLERVAGGGLEARESRRIFIVALCMVLVAVCAKAGWILAHGDMSTPVGAVTHELTAPFQKAPPGPTYLLTFAGLGILAMCVFFWMERRIPGSLPVRTFAVLGQSSFFVFILQFYVFAPMAVHPHVFGERWWWLSYLGAMVGIWLLALAWRRVRGNRIFDVTYLLTHPKTGKLPDPVGGAAH